MRRTSTTTWTNAGACRRRGGCPKKERGKITKRSSGHPRCGYNVVHISLTPDLVPGPTETRGKSHRPLETVQDPYSNRCAPELHPLAAARPPSNRSDERAC